jgi:hypothetical protein
MFIAGARDDVLKFPNSQAQIANFANTLPALRGCHILEGAGHWIQRERASTVTSNCLAFLAVSKLPAIKPAADAGVHAGVAMSLATRSENSGARSALCGLSKWLTSVRSF